MCYLRLCCPDRSNGPMPPSCAIHTTMLRKLNQTSPLWGRIKTFYKLNDIEDSMVPVFYVFLLLLTLWISWIGILLSVPLASKFFS